MLNMKRKSGRFLLGPVLLSLLCWLLMCLVLNACGPEQNAAGVATQPTLTPAATSTQSGTTAVVTTRTPISPIFTATPEATLVAASSSDWEYDWLKGKPCAVPCWEGITPGKTTYSEALKILQQLPFVRNIEEQKSTPSPGVLWQWKNDNRNSAGAEIRYDEKDTQSRITFIGLYLLKGFRLSDVIRIYGEPDYVWIEKQTTYIIRLVFLNPGITLVSDTKSKPTLNADMLFDSVWFVRSGDLEDYTKSLRCNCSLANLPRWQGYKSFDFYWNLILAIPTATPRQL